MLAVSSIFVYMQAIDPRTRMVLFRMLNRGVFDNINGCISTGKEVTFNLQCISHYMSSTRSTCQCHCICCIQRSSLLLSC
jgi:hypothetical protein